MHDCYRSVLDFDRITGQAEVNLVLAQLGLLWIFSNNVEFDYLDIILDRLTPYKGQILLLDRALIVEALLQKLFYDNTGIISGSQATNPKR